MLHIENPIAKVHPTKRKHEIRDLIKYFDMRKFLHGPTKALPIYPLWMINFPKRLYPWPTKDLILPLVHDDHFSPHHPHPEPKNHKEPLFWISSKKKIVIKRNGTYYFIRISQMRNMAYEVEVEDILDILHENMAIPVTVTIKVK